MSLVYSSIAKIQSLTLKDTMNDKTTIALEANEKNFIEIGDSSRLVAKPLVSVAMITYNHEEYIEEAINSVLMQETDFDVELIISNDNSPDQTDTIIQRILKEHPKSHWIKYIKHEKNIGMMPNLNDNFQRCLGKYIAICEGDDYWTDPQKLQKQIDFLENNPEYVITYSDIQAFDSNGHLQNPGGVTRDVEAKELQKCINISTLTTCFRNVVKELPPESLTARFGDLFIWSLLGQYGKGKFLGDIKPAKYRVHDGGVCSKKNPRQMLIMSQITSGALFAYYYRIGNQELADYFQKKNLRESIRGIGLYPFLQMIYKKIFKDIFLYIKKII